MSDPCDDYPPVPHLGNPSLVTWGTEEVGDNINIKVPFVSKEVEYVRGYYEAPMGDEGDGGGTDRWIEKEVWTLNGQIVECKGYKEILAAQETLRGIFSQDWQELKVGGGGDALEILFYGRVVSISFGESDYVDDIPYTVIIEGYRSADDLAASRAVVDPVASYTWTEAEDATMELRYEVSAKGIVTSDAENNALENAKNFVFDYLSEDNKIFKATSEDFQPYIIYKDKNYEGKRYLISDEEKIDRVAGSYGIVRVYKIDQTQGQFSSVLRYTTDSSKRFGEIKRLTFSGSIEIGYRGDINAEDPVDIQKNIGELRDRYYSFKKENLIDPDTKEALSSKNIISEKVDEDELGGLLTFNIVFGEPQVCIDDYDVTVEESSESSLVRVTVSGQASYKGPCDWEALLQCFYKTPDLTCKIKSEIVAEKCYDRAYEAYRQFQKDNTEVNTNGAVVNKFPLNLTITEDPNNKLINYVATFNDRYSYGAQSFDYTISVTPPVQQVILNSFQEIATDESDGDKTSCGIATPAKSHHYQDLGISRAGSVTGKLTIVGKSDQDGFKFLEGKATQAIGGASDMFLTKKNQGGNDTDECYAGGGSIGQSFQTHDCAWIFQKSGDVINPSSSDRTSITKIHFGSN